MEGARGMVDLKTQKTSYTKDSRLDEKQELELSRHQELLRVGKFRGFNV